MNCCQDCKIKKVGVKQHISICIDSWSSADLKRRIYLCRECIGKRRELLRSFARQAKAAMKENLAHCGAIGGERL